MSISHDQGDNNGHPTNVEHSKHLDYMEHELLLLIMLYFNIN